MPSIKDINTVKAIAREYCTNGHNKEQALKAVGYSDSYYKGGRSAEVVWGNERVKAEIDRILAEDGAEAQHTRSDALFLLQRSISWLLPKALAGDVPSIRALTDVVRELDSVCGLNKQPTASPQALPTLTDQERAELELAAKRLTTIRIHQGNQQGPSGAREGTKTG